MGFPQAVDGRFNRPSSATAKTPASPSEIEAAIARLEANADLSVQVQADLWLVAREYRALREVVREPLMELLVAFEFAVKDWEKEDRGPDFEAPLDSAMMALDDALDRFYTQCGIPPA